MIPSILQLPVPAISFWKIVATNGVDSRDPEKHPPKRLNLYSPRKRLRNNSQEKQIRRQQEYLSNSEKKPRPGSINFGTRTSFIWLLWLENCQKGFLKWLKIIGGFTKRGKGTNHLFFQLSHTHRSIWSIYTTWIFDSHGTSVGKAYHFPGSYEF